VRAAAIAAGVLACWLHLAPPATAQTDPTPGFTVTGEYTAAQPPPDARLESSRAARIASRDPKVKELSERYEALRFTTAWAEPGTWQVDYYPVGSGEDEKVVVQVHVNDATGERTETWTGEQVAWQMARGYPGAFGHKLNAPYVWLPLAAVFLLGLLDWRRPFRVAHLDLLVLLSFGISNHFLTRADIGLSVPLAYPPLLYLLARMLWIGFRAGRERYGGSLRPSAPMALLAVLTVALLGGRIALNLTSDHSVIDVGYAGVIGAERLVEGENLWGNFPQDNIFGDTYGPANYLAYVPFEAAFPWSGTWDDLPAARAAAIFFDLATVAGLFVLGSRLRPGDRRQGQALGVTMAFAWAAYPYTTYALQSNSNDALIAALLVWAMVLFSRPLARGALLGFAVMAKFAPLVLAPLFAAGERGLVESLEERRPPPKPRLRMLRQFSIAFAAVVALMLVHPATEAGLATFWERTLEMQLDRTSPFSIWGQTESLEWLQTTLKLLAVGLALAVAFVPRQRSLAQIAALGAAVLIATQLTVEHWFYLYIPWFLPLLLAAIVAPGTPRGAAQAAS
jgi:Glycosyltransferase family 87